MSTIHDCIKVFNNYLVQITADEIPTNIIAFIECNHSAFIDAKAIKINVLSSTNDQSLTHRIIIRLVSKIELFPNLETLYVQCNGMSRSHQLELIGVICARRLTCVSLIGNFELIKHSYPMETLVKSIPHLHIEGTDFGWLGARSTTNIILSSTEPTPISLLFPNNDIGNRGVSYLSGALNKNVIVELDLSNNKISRKGIGSLCNNMQHNTGLKRLNLTGNSIRDGGLMRLALCLHQTGIEALILDNTGISSKGVLDFADNLTQNENIKRISFKSNAKIFNQKQIISAVNIMKVKCKALVYLEFDDTKLPSEALIRIQEAMKGNH